MPDLPLPPDGVLWAICGFVGLSIALFEAYEVMSDPFDALLARPPAARRVAVPRPSGPVSPTEAD